jgi:hypothetical protein
MKKFISVLLVFLILLVGFGGMQVSASNDELKTFIAIGQSTAGYVADEIIVKFKNDNKPYRVVKSGCCLC